MKTLSVTLRSILATFVLFALVTLPVNAQVDLKKTGQGTMNFQLVGLSARSAGMGNATYAVSSGAEAIFMNPAGLAEMTKSVDVDLMFTSWIADITYKAGAVAWKMGKYGTLGASALGVDYGTINGTRITAQTVGGPQYEDIGPLTNVNAYSFGLSYAAALNESFSIGGTARYTGQNLGVSLLSSGLKDNNAHKMVFDIGVKYYPGYKSFRFGMAFRNFSSQLQREELNDQMPVTFTIATAMDLMDVVSPAHSPKNNLTLGVDYLHSNNYTERFNLGLEYIMQGMVAFRGGYETNHDLASWSAGIGLMTSISTYDVRVDYSYSRFQYFNGVNRFSLGLVF